MGERIGAVVLKGLKPVLAGSLRKYRGIDADTVARAMIAAAHPSCGAGDVYESDRIEELAMRNFPA